MNIFILTNSDGSPIADRTAAAVTSVTDDTEVDDIGNLVLGDTEPFVVKFTTGTAAPSFAGDSTYTFTMSLGSVTTTHAYNYATSEGVATTTGGWTARLPLTDTDLIAAVQAGGGGWATQVQGTAGPVGAWMALQIRITNPSGYTYTYALLRVFVEWPVV